MRRFRQFAVGLVALFGIWFVWRQFVQRRSITRQDTDASGSLSPVWSSTVIPSEPAQGTIAATTERSHNQSDSLTQPQEPAAPPPPQTSADVPDTKLQREPTGEPDTVSESQAETATIQPDDLLKIEGIGPKISTIVDAAGITTFAELAATDVGRLEAILDEAGIHTANPSTWPQQAQLAAQGKWDELKELQDRIKNGQLEA